MGGTTGISVANVDERGRTQSCAILASEENLQRMPLCAFRYFRRIENEPAQIRKPFIFNDMQNKKTTNRTLT
jgi:hypothetical protein